MDPSTGVFRDNEGQNVVMVMDIMTSKSLLGEGLHSVGFSPLSAVEYQNHHGTCLVLGLWIHDHFLAEV